MQKLLCKLGLHDYRSVGVTSCFVTEYIDRNWGPIKHVVYYQECFCCGKRRLKENYRKETIGSRHRKHAGIEHARVSWETYARMYLGDGNDFQHQPRNNPPPRGKKLKVIGGGKDG